MVLQILLTYKNLILQSSLCVSLTLFLTFLKIPTFFLNGLYTYIHPDNVNSGVRATIRRPESSKSGSGVDGYQNLSSKTGSEVRKKTKSKEKFEFDEQNAQIFRLKLDENHLQTRIYFKEYCNAFTFSFVGISCLLLQSYLAVSEKAGVLESGIFVPVLFGLLAINKVLVSLAKVSFEKSASRRLDKQLSLLLGLFGFVLGLTIFSIRLSILDFDFGAIDGFGTFLIAASMGCLAGFLFLPATKSARAFWLGTDQLQCKLEMVSCGLFARVILFASSIFSTFTPLLWISPFVEILVRKKIWDDKGADLTSEYRDANTLLGNLGFLESDFANLRLWCLLLSAILQIMALRPNLQMYLNEALLSWYQRLHAGKVPDLDFSRAKVFLHNHYLCLSLLQFFSPPAIILLLVGLSQIDCYSFEKIHLVRNLLPCNIVVKQVPLFMAWWVVFVCAIYTSASIVLYRRGISYVS